jgi:hypothetical protein
VLAKLRVLSQTLGQTLLQYLQTHRGFTNFLCKNPNIAIRSDKTRRHSFFLFPKFDPIGIIENTTFAAGVAANTPRTTRPTRFHHDAEGGLEETRLTRKVNRPAILIDEISKTKTLTVTVATAGDSCKKALARRHCYLQKTRTDGSAREWVRLLIPSRTKV